MLSLENIGIEFAGRWLIRNAGYRFNEGKITGLIGRNGAGKSSLLRVIAGQNMASEGMVHRGKDDKLAYFHQDLLSFETETSIFEMARSAFATLLEHKHRLEDIFVAIEGGSMDLDLWDEMAHLQAEWDAMEGDKIDARTYEILAGLGFKDTEVHQPYKTFSGGWRMRVLLAKMLLEQPDVLLLDEPTNHLDLPSIQWLENYLESYPGVCIIVSHDRFFLDRMVDVILEISNAKLNEYAGNYSFYIEAKAERSDLQQRAYENQQKYISDQQRFIDRFKAKASKARQAQSKIKQLDKLDLVDAPEEDDFNLSFTFKVRTPSGREVIKLGIEEKSFGIKKVLRDSEAVIERGDKIALIGANGLGKSTLLRMVGGSEPFEGDRKEGHNVALGFFAQHQLEALNLKNNVLQELAYIGTDKTEVELRTVLGCFMFSGEDVEKKINVLSGGEKSRVALAKVLISEANFLLLDEPTNHLDIPSIQILMKALQNYQGTYIVISHDRHFLSCVANKIWYIEDQQLKEYPGTYHEFEEMKTRKMEAERLLMEEDKQKQKEQKKPKVEEKKPKVEEKPVVSFEEQKQRKNRLRKMEKEQEDIEAEIEQMEKEKKALMLSLVEPSMAANFTKIAEVQKQIDHLTREIALTTEKWEKIVAEVEEMQKVLA